MPNMKKIEDNKPKTLRELAAETPTTRYNSRPNYYQGPSTASRVGCWAVSLGLVGLASVGLVAGYTALHPEKDVTVKVTDKVRTGGDDSKYLIFTSGGVYEDVDTFVKGKYNSSDLYGRIKVGQTYTFHVRGVRNHILSMYPNIITMKPVK